MGQNYNDVEWNIFIVKPYCMEKKKASRSNPSTTDVAYLKKKKIVFFNIYVYIYIHKYIYIGVYTYYFFLLKMIGAEII